jgi:hypothetical protein
VGFALGLGMGFSPSITDQNYICSIGSDVSYATLAQLRGARPYQAAPWLPGTSLDGEAA